MLKNVTIALDAMSGDYGPSAVLLAAREVLHHHNHLKLILVGDQQVLKDRLKKMRGEWLRRIEIEHAPTVIAMEETVAQALRTKRDSSMRVAINLVHEKKAHAMVSAGNTAALMAIARFVLKMLPGLDRPTIMANFPTGDLKHVVRVLDVGANVDCTPNQLLQFAIMGSVMAHTVGGIKHPRVSLLNIGEETIKGNEQVRQTAELLIKSDLNYTGFIEPDDIFKGITDVVVCDGFVGNVALKMTEGTARLIHGFIRAAFLQNWLTMGIGVIAKPVLKTITRRVDPSRYNGASLLGLRGIVVKSHGGSRAKSFVSAIEYALREIDHDIIPLIEEYLSKI